MKLIRFGAPGEEKPGIYLNEKRYDLSTHVSDYNEEFFKTNGLARLKEIHEQLSEFPEVSSDSRWAAPIARPSKIICIGLNYADHAAESNMELPKEPVVFFKATSAIVGPFDELIIPKNSTKTDWEVELSVIMGKQASYIDESKAPDYIAG